MLTEGGPTSSDADSDATTLPTFQVQGTVLGFGSEISKICLSSVLRDAAQVSRRLIRVFPPHFQPYSFFSPSLGGCLCHLLHSFFGGEKRLLLLPVLPAYLVTHLPRRLLSSSSPSRLQSRSHPNEVSVLLSRHSDWISQALSAGCC